jgi:hypothetical protein
MTAERLVIEIELIPDLLVNGMGDANGAGLGESLEACSDVNAIAKDVAATAWWDEPRLSISGYDPVALSFRNWPARIFWCRSRPSPRLDDAWGREYIFVLGC